MSKANQGKCAGCGASIIWATTEKGHQCPYDAAAVTVYEPDLLGVMHATGKGHTSHFVTCPQRDEFSKGKEKKVAAPKPAPEHPHATDVRDAFVAKYQAKYGVPPHWNGEQAKLATDMMARVRKTFAGQTPEQLTATIGTLIDAYLADADQFLVKQTHGFRYMADRLATYIGRTGTAKAGGSRDGAWR